MPFIETHAHVVPDAVLARFPGGTSPKYVTAERAVLGRMFAAQEAVGISHAVLSDSFYMETASEELPGWSLRDRARLFNDGMAELVGRHPARLFGLGCVEPWDGEESARELERIVGGLGLRGALINPSDGRRYLDDPTAEPLLAAAEQLGVPLFVHPTRDLPAMDQYEEFALSLVIGRPTQTTVCASRLIFSGTLDRHPGLTLVLAHGAGALPYVAGRLDATWSAYRGAGRWPGPDVLERPPSTYLRRFYADTNTWSTGALRLALDVFGSDRLVFGTDQPPVWFPIEQSVAALDCLNLPPDEIAALQWLTAARLYRLEV